MTDNQPAERFGLTPICQLSMKEQQHAISGSVFMLRLFE